MRQIAAELPVADSSPEGMVTANGWSIQLCLKSAFECVLPLPEELKSNSEEGETLRSIGCNLTTCGKNVRSLTPGHHLNTRTHTSTVRRLALIAFPQFRSSSDVGRPYIEPCSPQTSSPVAAQHIPSDPVDENDDSANPSRKNKSRARWEAFDGTTSPCSKLSCSRRNSTTIRFVTKRLAVSQRIEAP